MISTATPKHHDRAALMGHSCSRHRKRMYTTKCSALDRIRAAHERTPKFPATRIYIEAERARIHSRNNIVALCRKSQYNQNCRLKHAATKRRQIPIKETTNPHKSTDPLTPLKTHVHVYVVVRATYSVCSQFHPPSQGEESTNPTLFAGSKKRSQSHYGSNKQMPNHSLANANCMPACVCASPQNANAMRPQAGPSRPVAPARYRLQCDGIYSIDSQIIEGAS